MASPSGGATTPHLRAAAKPRKETEIQREILRYLAACPGVCVWRMNSRVVRMPGKGGRERLVRFGFEGCPDLLGWVDYCLYPRAVGLARLVGCDSNRILHVARFFGVEVKRPGKKPSLAQETFAARLIAAGGLFIVAECVDDVRKALGR